MKTLSQNWVVAALAATWLAAQNVGIGTTTPLTRLHVAAGDIFLGEATGNNGFILYSRSWTGYDFLQITSRTASIYEWGKGITFVRSTGNVGIGTTTPAAKLHVYDNSDGEIRLEGVNKARFLAYSGGQLWIQSGSAWSSGSTADIRFSGMFGSPIHMTIQGSTGNVGIGTTAPHSAAILQLQATNKGFLPTQVALTSATSWSPLVGTSVDGMLVYNTNTAGTGQNAVSPGYYYWRAGRWRRFSENAYAGMIQGVLYAGNQDLTSDCPTNQYLNSYIDLPPGKWIVYSIQLLKPTINPPSTTGSIWVVTTFSDNTSCSSSSPDIIGSGLMSGLLPNQTWHSLLIGQVIINNTSGGVKRYHYCGCKNSYFGYNAGLTNFSTTSWGESQLYALPAE
jgi:hypothetical protein